MKCSDDALNCEACRPTTAPTPATTGTGRRCGWCGVFVAADTKPTPMVNVLGEPRVWDALCPPCAKSCRYLAARNVVRQPNEAHLRSLRGWGR